MQPLKLAEKFRRQSALMQMETKKSYQMRSENSPVISPRKITEIRQWRRQEIKSQRKYEASDRRWYTNDGEMQSPTE